MEGLSEQVTEERVPGVGRESQREMRIQAFWCPRGCWRTSLAGTVPSPHDPLQDANIGADPDNGKEVGDDPLSGTLASHPGIHTSGQIHGLNN